MNKKARKQEIYEQLKSSQFISIEELAKQFEVSEMTIRRDLLELEKQGVVVRAIGGAYSSYALDKEVSIEEKKVKNIHKKKKIAEAGLKLIKEDMTIFLDSGSTCFELAYLLKSKKFNRLNIITQDLSIINLLKNVKGISLIVLGGLFSNETHSMNGFLTQLCIDRLSADIAFVGASSISEELKILTPSENKIFSKIGMTKNAKISILLVDSSKFMSTNLYYVQELSDFDLVITDLEINSSIEEKLNKKEINYMKV